MVRTVRRSMSFKTTTPARSIATESKVKMLSSNFYWVDEVRRLKPVIGGSGEI